MVLIKYIKKYIILIILFAGAGVVFNNAISSAARDNAYLASFIDEESCMYKFQVVYSGTEVELGRVDWLLTNDAKLSQSNSSNRLALYGYSASYTYNANSGINSGGTAGTVSHGINGESYITNIEIEDTTNTKKGTVAGEIYVTIKDYDSGDTVDPVSINYGVADGDFTDDTSKPLTFPSDSSVDASAADINRAYDVMDALCEDFKEALIYLNSGETYTSVDSLIETAYYLVTAQNGSTITGANGDTYTITFASSAKSGSNGCLYTVKIAEKGGKSETFVYKIKKGYYGFDNDDLLEDGSVNNLTITDGAENDTEFITWEHLYLQAGILYAEGITWANQADIYTVNSLESSLVSMTRNLLGQVKGLLQLYSMEDLIFNTGTRGSSAYVFGAYYTSWNDSTGRLFLVILAITLSFITITIINMAMKAQYSTISSVARASLFDDVKNLIVAIIAMVFIWVIIKLLLLINFQFCDIFATLAGDKTLSDSGGGYSTLGAIIYQIVYFVIAIYLNAVYILRQFFLPVLIIISPLCLLAYAYGPSGRRITQEWMKELIGIIFMQSIHAFVYGFILANTTSLRGIESIICCASIIPLTSMISSIFGLGGGELIKTARAHTNTARAVGTGVVSGATSLASGALNAVGNVAGNVPYVGKALNAGFKAAGSGVSMAGNLTNAGLNTGFNLAMGSGEGTGSITGGLSNAGSDAGNMAVQSAQAATSLVAAVPGAVSGVKSAVSSVKQRATGETSKITGMAVGTTTDSNGGMDNIGYQVSGSGATGTMVQNYNEKGKKDGMVVTTAGTKNSFERDENGKLMAVKKNLTYPSNNPNPSNRRADLSSAAAAYNAKAQSVTPSAPTIKGMNRMNFSNPENIHSQFGENIHSFSSDNNRGSLTVPSSVQSEQDFNTLNFYNGLKDIEKLKSTDYSLYKEKMNGLKKDYHISDFSFTNKQIVTGTDDKGKNATTKVSQINLTF